MKPKKLLAFCLCLSISISATACNIIRPEKNNNSVTLNSETNHSVSSSAISSRIDSASVPKTNPDQSSTLPDSQTSTGKWIEKAPMSRSRYDFGLETANDKIYAIGGDSRDGELDSVEEYNSAANQWRKKKPMPTARSGLQTALLGGKIYAIGGTIGRQSSSAVERYDPAADRWTSLSPLKNPREYFQAAVLDGTIYVMGGSADATITSSVEAYDSLSNTWTEKAPMPVPKMQFQAEIIGGKIYAVGGLNPVDGVGPAVNSTSVEVYDPATNKWTEKSAMKTPRFSFRTEIAGGKIFAIGGVNDQVNALPSVEEYDPSTDRWSPKKGMNLARSGFQTALANGKIIAIGGGKKAGYDTRDNFLSSVEEYDPVTDTLTEKAPLHTPRGWFQSAVLNGQLYVLGGTDGSSNNRGREPGLASLEVYRFQSN